MPPCVKRTPEELNLLRRDVAPSVVTVDTYDRTCYSLIFSTGFIVYSDKNQTLICVNNSVLVNEKRMFVHFSDGSVKKSKVLVNDLSTGHVILVVDEDQVQDREGRKAVTFSHGAHGVRREDVYVMTEVETFKGFNFMSGSVINPACRPVGDDGNHIDLGSRELFSFSCAAVGRDVKNWDAHKRQIIGAAVFNGEAQVIGSIESIDQLSYDLKFAFRTSCWIDEMESKIKAKDPKFSIIRA